MSDSAKQHRLEAQQIGTLSVSILTLSDTRTAETDESGNLIFERVNAAGHRAASPVILRDEPDLIEDFIKQLLAGARANVLLICGGTGISPRDQTFDSLTKMYDKPLPGFGEIFRQLSYEEIGPAAILSRASAGVIGNLAVFSMPGSVNAVRLALEKLILPELAHVVREIRKGSVA